MAEDFKNIDQIIRQKFDDFSPEPPAYVWEKIRSGIQNEPPAPAPSSGIILPLIVSISILIFLSGLFHHFFTTKTDTEVTANSTKTAGIISTGSTTVTDPSPGRLAIIWALMCDPPWECTLRAARCRSILGTGHPTDLDACARDGQHPFRHLPRGRRRTVWHRPRSRSPEARLRCMPRTPPDRSGRVPTG